jgi:phenylacetate-CoA ligase
VECSAGHFHVHEDHFLPEVQDGELVLTTLCREALPLLRYRTRVRCELTREKCSCGRTGAIIVPGSRLDGRLRINETPLYQDQIAEVLARTKVAGQPFNVTVSERRISVSVEISDELFDDTVGFIEELTRQIESEFLARLGIEADVRFIPPRSHLHAGPGSDVEPDADGQPVG